MKPINVKSGELYFNFNYKNEGSRVTYDFLMKLLLNIIENSIKYYNETKKLHEPEHAFTFREKQFHSILCPSIASITPCFLIEHPLRRKPRGEKEYAGHVDYWISFHENSYLLELKHTYQNYTRVDNPRKTISKRFVVAIKQLNNIKKEQ